MPDGTEPRALAWWKAADPAWRPAEAALAAAEDARVGTVNDTGGRTELVTAGPPGAAPAAGPWAVAAGPSVSKAPPAYRSCRRGALC